MEFVKTHILGYFAIPEDTEVRDFLHYNREQKGKEYEEGILPMGFKMEDCV